LKRSQPNFVIETTGKAALEAMSFIFNPLSDFTVTNIE